jgi:phage pi2 protein 07
MSTETEKPKKKTKKAEKEVVIFCGEYEISQGVDTGIIWVAHDSGHSLKFTEKTFSYFLDKHFKGYM